MAALTSHTIRLQLAGNYAALVLADGPVGYWRLGESEGYAQAVLSDGPFGFWRLGDASGTVATDSSGNGRNGTYNAGTTLNADGALSDGSKATDFSGAPAANVTNTNTLAAITGACSLEGWFNADTVAAGLFHVIWISSSGDSYIAINTVGGITSAFSLGGLSRSIASSAALVSTGAWYHIVATWDADKIRLYVNGALVNTSASFVGALSLGAGTFRIGTNNGGGEALDGRIDEVAVYNYTLSMQQIANHYALRTSTIATVAAATVADSSGNGRTATIAGGVTLQQPTPQPDLNTAALFDGVASYASVPTYDAAAGRTAISLEGWVNHNGAAWNAVQAEIFLSLGSTGHYISVNSFGALCSLRISGTQNLLQSAATVPTTGWHHIVVTWTSGDSIRLYVDGVLSNTSAVFSGTLDSAPGITLGAFSSGAGFRLAGAADELAVYTYALTAAQVTNRFLAGQWTDVGPTGSQDLTDDDLVLDYGIRSSRPEDRVATTGTLSFGLRNDAGNSGATLGWYSPYNPARRPGFGFGLRVQLVVVNAGVTYYWLGRLRVIDALPDAFGDRVVHCVATDWLDEAARANTQVALQTSTSGGAAFTALVACVPRPPAITAIGTGSDTYVYAFDNIWQSAKVLSALADLARSEFGYVYQKRDHTIGETVVFENRHARVLTSVLRATLSLSMATLAIANAAADIINHVRVRVYPRLPVSGQVIATLSVSSTSPASIAPGDAQDIWIDYTDPVQRSSRIGATGQAALVATTDYTMNTAPDGSGVDITASFAVTATSFASSVKFHVTNTGATVGYLTKLQQRGTAIYTLNPIEAEKKVQASIDAYGDNLAEFDLPYQSDSAFAKIAADYIAGIYAAPLANVRAVSFWANQTTALLAAALDGEISDTVQLVESVTGLTAAQPFYINAVKWQISQTGQVDCTWQLAPADGSAYWVLGQAGASELGVTTRLGF